METDEFQQQIDQMRQHLLMGVEGFHLGPFTLATLIDESDALQEHFRFGEAFGINQLLGFLSADDRRVAALFELLGAEVVGESHYKVRFDEYVGCFWRRDGHWAWDPESLDGEVIEPAASLVQQLIAKSN
jgi:hypothetical protein